MLHRDFIFGVRLLSLHAGRAVADSGRCLVLPIELFSQIGLASLNCRVRHSHGEESPVFPNLNTRTLRVVFRRRNYKHGNEGTAQFFISADMYVLFLLEDNTPLSIALNREEKKKEVEAIRVTAVRSRRKSNEK